MNEESQADQEEKYYCGVCGWVAIDIFPNCHPTAGSATDTEKKEEKTDEQE